jgi:asparagine synthase (glutamine-hydrolysing)
MRRRGPDDESFVTRKTRDGTHLSLLHARLSIIDLDSRARQPFTNGGDTLCYNGEVYSYLELRRRLAAPGTTFQTASDTEVLARVRL